MTDLILDVVDTTDSFETGRRPAPRKSGLLRILSAALAAAMVSGAALPALAQDAPQLKVKLDGVDMASPDGARLALRRIRLAARAVCDANGVRSLKEATYEAGCRDQAVRRAVADLKQPVLAALLDPKAGERLAAAER